MSEENSAERNHRCDYDDHSETGSNQQQHRRTVAARNNEKASEGTTFELGARAGNAGFRSVLAVGDAVGFLACGWGAFDVEAHLGGVFACFCGRVHVPLFGICVSSRKEELVGCRVG